MILNQTSKEKTLFGGTGFFVFARESDRRLIRLAGGLCFHEQQGFARGIARPTRARCSTPRDFFLVRHHDILQFVRRGFDKNQRRAFLHPATGLRTATRLAWHGRCLVYDLIDRCRRRIRLGKHRCHGRNDRRGRSGNGFNRLHWRWLARGGNVLRCDARCVAFGCGSHRAFCRRCRDGSGDNDRRSSRMRVGKHGGGGSLRRVSCGCNVRMP